MLESAGFEISLSRRNALYALWGAALLELSEGGPRAFASNPSEPVASIDRRWLDLPATPSLPPASDQAVVELNGTPLFFCQFGKGADVLLLHGGLANSNYWGFQVSKLAQHFRVTVMDTRGHGRSAVTSDLFGYAQFARDVVALLKHLGISKSAVVGWSDGAITGIQLALIRPDLISGLFAFGANTNLQGLIAGGANTKVFRLFSERCRREYLSLSPHPERWSRLRSGLVSMWRSQPTFTKSQLSGIAIPVMIADGEHEEIIRPEHTREISTQIPHAQLSIMKGVSHFALLQDPAQFNAQLLQFLSSVLP